MGLSGCGPAVVRNGLLSATLVNGSACRHFVGGILQDLSLVLDFRGNSFFTWSSFTSFFLLFLSDTDICVHIHIYISICISLCIYLKMLDAFIPKKS